MFFRNLQIYRLPAPWAITADALASMLAAQAFAPPSSNELLRQGWDAPRPNGGLVHTVNKQMMLLLRTEKKLLPVTVVNQVTKARAAELEEAQGFAPGKKAMKELKERVADELLPRAFSIQSTTPVWIDPVNGWLVIDAASPAKADEAIKLLLKSVDRMPLESLRVQRSPVGVMTEWLQTDEAPAGFTVDQDATLRATGESKAQVQYKRHTLGGTEVAEHIKAGKQCTRLAMTWDSKISFVLDESLAVKSVKPLDVLTEEVRGTSRNDDERFDGDFMLMTGELVKMLFDLVEALGGEATMGEPRERKAAPASSASGDEPVRPQRMIGQQKFERALGLTSELYANRARYRDVLNELYPETIRPYIEKLQATMTETGEGAIKAALALSKALPQGSQSGPMFLAAAVEIMEQSGATEPAANGQGLGAVPAGDGSVTDPLYEAAVTVVRANQRASISLIQRHLRIGYNRASRLLDAMEAVGVISEQTASGRRELPVGPQPQPSR